jgi:hypothetical protein
MSRAFQNRSSAKAAAMHEEGVADARATSSGTTHDQPDAAVLARWGRRGIWLLPVYALLLALSTVTHQPDYTTDFAGYSRYVTTGGFLASHLVASILVGNVLFTAIFAAAAFAQPAIGQAWLDGAHSVAQSVNSDVYGPPLFATFAVGAPLFIAGAVLMGVAVARRSPELHRSGIGYAVFLPLFLVSGFLFDVVQPVMAVFLLVATLVIARRLQHAD